MYEDKGPYLPASPGLLQSTRTGTAIIGNRHHQIYSGRECKADLFMRELMLEKSRQGYRVVGHVADLASRGVRNLAMQVIHAPVNARV